MSQYYFTVASLPLLSLDEQVGMDLDQFMLLCAEHLSAQDYSVLVSARGAFEAVPGPANAATAHPVMGAFIARERSLRIELARLRAPQVGWGGDELAAFPPDSYAAALAREIMNQDSPLSAENLLDHARWSLLDDLEVGHYFDTGKLVIYLFRLLILERRKKIDSDRGAERFEHTYSVITEERVRAHTEIGDDER